MSDFELKLNDLPSTWALTNLGAVVDYGRTAKAEPSEISSEDWVLELEDIEKETSYLLQRMTFAQRQSKSTKNKFQAGDVLYGKLRPYLNKVLIADQAGYCTTEIVPIKAGSHLDNRYLFYWLKHPAFLKYVEAKSHGMNMPRLGTDTGKAAPFVLAPRNEQTRIADQLDKLLARIQACNDRIDAIPALLKRFRKSILATSALVESSEISSFESNSAKQLREVLLAVRTGPFGSALHKSDYVVNGIPVINPMHIRGGRLVADQKMTVSGSTADRLSEFRLKVGDVILGRRGEMGRCAVVSELEEGWLCGTGSMILRPAEILAPRYLQLFLSSPSVVAALEGASVGSTMTNLNQNILLDLRIVLPSMDTQLEIVRRVEALFQLADRIEARHAAARAQAQRLTPLLLAKAFRGELVPQDPNDEPASVLLERIETARAVTAAQSRPKKSASRRKPARSPKEISAMTKSRQDDDVKGQPYLAKHLRLLGGSASAEALFKASELPVADFYKQLAWEVAQGHLRDGGDVLELADAA
ncbi:restriction endonuclease subunit S [Thiobacillus sp.]|uniref:restriction endonuclease subunit S n=1 Tax=Thiobacillus sp. TaxID=924 RepID=UPI001790EED4|nr:restriction endonuclease subunit S [Thiobacillus sp.]MBC2731497.1 hypothetical protein [Thiobacillus sp.]MBC2740236.1 restriction endonuclease subunit S [Thiobacillus sp.]MBC2758449.1 restriction endonuclease subunit S [Thiobacillus sp.]